MIAPIALLIAVAHVLNKLSNDSEIIVMNSAGMSPWVLFRAFLPVAIVVALLVTAISAYFAPKGLRMLRNWLTEVRANVVSTIVQPGRFTAMESGVTIHIRERRNNGQLLGIFLDDRRDPAERVTVLAESGDLLDNDNGTFLVLQKGMVQRKQVDRARSGDRGIRPLRFRPVAILRRPAGGEIFDPRALSVATPVSGSQRTRFTREQPGQFRAELFDRLMAPFYPLAFLVIAFAYLGAPRTTRQSRTLSLIGADRRRRAAALDRLRLHGFRRELSPGWSGCRSSRSSPPSASASPSSAAA